MPKNKPHSLSTAGRISRRTVLAGIGGFSAATILRPRASFAQEADLIVYSSLPATIQDRVVKGFEAKFGVKLNTLRLTSPVLAQRFIAEQRAGQHACDILTLSVETVFQEASKQGLLAPLAGIPEYDALKEPWKRSTHYFCSGAQGLTIAYNTKTVSDSLAPKGWEDILKAEFKDGIVTPDPRAGGSTLPFWLLLRRTYGDDFIRNVGKQNLKLVSAMAQGLEHLAAGEYKLLVPCTNASFYPFLQSGAPARLTPIPSPTTGIFNNSGIAANAPHMELAKKYIGYLASAEGQQVQSKDILISPLGDLPGSIKAPAQLVNVDEQEANDASTELFDLLGLPA